MISAKHSPVASSPPSRRRSAQLSTPVSPATHQLRQQQQQQTPVEQDERMTEEESAIPFPSPQVFDILPPLHALLSRLVSNAADRTATGGLSQPNGGPPGSQTLTGEGVVGNNGVSDPLGSTSFLDPKVLLTEASAIKIRIQKARAVVAELPDIDRTIDEQMEEIEVLERKIRKLKTVVGEFGELSAQAMKEAESR